MPKSLQHNLLDAAPAPTRHSRPQLVDRILELNPTATTEFLATFSEDSLAPYLDHLNVVGDPCLPWGRRGLQPAVVQRDSAA